MGRNDSILAQQTICFAAVCQAASLIHQLARSGTWNEEVARILIRGLAVDSPESIDEIYPVDKIQVGLKKFIEIFGKDVAGNGMDQNTMLDHARMAMSFVNLGTAIYKQLIDTNSSLLFTPRQRFSPEIFSKLDSALYLARTKGYRPTSDENTANIAQIYTEEISEATKGHIKIYGQAGYLKQPCIQNRIRTLIFSAVRAVILWRQLGGKRRTFIFRRRNMLVCAQSLLKAYV